VNARCLFVCSALLLFANGAHGGGTYQRTKDGKSLVWNDYAKPGYASATWSGERDADGYATGYGTLTWYRVELKTATGSLLPVIKHAAVSRYSGKMVRGKLDGPVVNVDANGKTFHGTFVDGRNVSDWAPGPVPGPSRTGIALDRRRNKGVRRAVLVEAPAEGPSPVAEQRASENVSVRAATEPPGQSSDFLRSLTAPPSSLQARVTAEASPQPSIPPTSSSPFTRPRLTTMEVTGLADAEARAQGYNLGEYQRPQVHYTATDDRWSVIYDQKSIDDMAETGKHFSVTVEDKTKKTSIIPGK
jgi:hypothetical protein